MAAHLKKRAFAEFSQVIQEQPQPVKRLRLVQKPEVHEITLNLQDSTTTQQTLQILFKLEEQFPLDSENAVTVSRQLLEHFEREKESIVRVKIAVLLREIAGVPDFNTETLAEEILHLIKDEKSHKVLAQLMSTALKIGHSLSPNSMLHTQILEVARQNLTDTSHLVRSRCLQLIGALGSHELIPSEDSSSEDKISLQMMLSHHVNDQDPRVRSSAIQALLQFHQRGMMIEKDVYMQACDMLKDDYEAVRLAATKLIWVLSHLYPDSPVKLSNSDEEVRLVDDGFGKICNMVTDISMIVRAEAARLLGSLHAVSPKFLEQTLDKKLISNMRKKVSAHERAKEHYMSGEWSTGQKWADDAPKEEVDVANINLMSVGACGAFIHGLEDEFFEVRNAALDSLCELASHSANFANLSQDSIIDMFNDEIESVRLNAINSLRKISQYIVLREDQLDIILGVLKDYSYATREVLRDMLCDMKLATRECLNGNVMALLDNMKRYPQDRTSIWKCMQNLGKHHPELTLTIVADLLCIHPYFDTPEPEMDDPSYISVLVLVFNAAFSCPTILPMFQEHTWRHYIYLHDSLPEMVPQLQVPGQALTGSDSMDSISSRDTSNFLNQTIRKLDKIENLDTQTAHQLLEIAVRDLERLSEVDDNLSSSAECVCLFLQSQLLLTKLQAQSQTFMNTSVTTDQILTLVRKVMTHATELRMKYLGLGNIELAMIHQTQLKALTFYLTNSLSNSINSTDQKPLQSFVSYLKDIQRFLTSSEIAPDKFTLYLLSEISSLEIYKPHIFLKVLQYSLHFIKPSSFPISNKIRRSTAKIHEPASLSDNSIKFAAGLTTAVTLDATIENVAQVQNISIRVKYPDSEVQLIPCKASDFKKLNTLRHRLVTQVLLSHAQWSESCQVELSLVLTPGSLKSSSSNISVNLSDFDLKTEVTQLCKPVSVLIQPRPAKR